jgi:excisionase family DNA binding protein
MSESVLVSKREAARSLSVCLRTLDVLIGEGKIPTRRIGRRVLIARRHLQEFALGIRPARRRTEMPWPDPGTTASKPFATGSEEFK